MNLVSFLKYALCGLLLGFCAALFGIMQKQKRLMKHGIYVTTTHLQKNKVLEASIRKIRPFFQISSVLMAPEYVQTVRTVDDLVRAVLCHFYKQPVENKKMFTNTNFDVELVRKLEQGLKKPRTRQYDQAILGFRTAVNELTQHLRQPGNQRELQNM